LPPQRIVRSGPVDIRKYPAVSPKFNLFGPIEISRGCPFGCRFCQTTYLFGPLRHRTIKQIVWGVEQMGKQNLDDIRFVTPNLLSYGSDDGFKPNLVMLEKMLFAVKKTKSVKRVFAGSFPSEIRPEQITKKALLIIKKYCSNDNIIIGAQSGSDQMLKLMHRGHTVDDVLRAINLAKEVGFKANVDFIFGMPGEKPEDEKATMKFMKKIVKTPGVRIHSHTFLPLAGTPWAGEKSGRISPELRQFLEELRRDGKEFGDWKEQEVFAQKLPKVFSNS
jgi:B12-binding domain/radical SAM domain protein